MKFLAPAVIALSLLCVACGSDTPTTPTTTTTTTTTTTVAPASISETWESTVPAGGSRFFSFSVVENGTVTVSLTSVSGQFVPSTVTLGLGLGQPDGTDCTTTTTVNVSSAAANPQITGTYAPGVYCARVFDVGNLFSAANFVVSIAHS